MALGSNVGLPITRTPQKRETVKIIVDGNEITIKFRSKSYAGARVGFNYEITSFYAPLKRSMMICNGYCDGLIVEDCIGYAISKYQRTMNGL